MSGSGRRRALTHAAEYLRSRQSCNGGFCFYRYGGLDEPNLHDTYHAVAAFRLLGEEVPRGDETSRFLAAFPAAGVHQLYYCVFALDMLGRAQLDDGRLQSIASLTLHVPERADAASPSGWLEAALRLLRLRKRLGRSTDGEIAAAFVAQLESEGGGYGDKPNLLDTFSCLRILALLAKPLPAAAARFVERLQMPSFGFTMSEDSSMASLELVEAGVKCCAMLGVPVRYPADALAFALACQTGNGGFSRTPGALPGIEQTRRALQVIALLASPPPG